MKICTFSDSHTMHQQVAIPEGDILIFAGDMNNCRNMQDVAAFNSFLGTLPHKHKIVVGGNHDHQLAADSSTAKKLLSNAIYLQDEMVVIQGISIYGSPWQPQFNDYACDAFALPRGNALDGKWRLIPANLDILVTHSPPAGIMDQDGPVSHGCTDLHQTICEKQPRLHIFGHIHSQHGSRNNCRTTFINCNVQGKAKQLRPATSFLYERSKLFIRQ